MVDRIEALNAQIESQGQIVEKYKKQLDDAIAALQYSSYSVTAKNNKFKKVSYENKKTFSVGRSTHAVSCSECTELQ